MQFKDGQVELREDERISRGLKNLAGEVGVEQREPILVEREKTHGDYRSTAEIAQRLKKVIHDNTQTTHVHFCNVHRESLEMICTKIARILAGDPAVQDHWDDIAGYAKLGAEATIDSRTR